MDTAVQITPAMRFAAHARQCELEGRQARAGDSVSGSHSLPDGTVCHCGPANLYSGPQWVIDANAAHAAEYAARLAARELPRLTSGDYRRIDEQVASSIRERAHVVRQTNRAHFGEYNAAGDVLTLTRLAHHAIGCSADDLRDAELVLIDQQVDALIWAYSNTITLGDAAWTL